MFRMRVEAALDGLAIACIVNSRYSLAATLQNDLRAAIAANTTGLSLNITLYARIHEFSACALLEGDNSGR